MSPRIQSFRGLEADRETQVFLEGEVAYTTDTKKLYVGDGVTPGGTPVGNIQSVFGRSDENILASASDYLNYYPALSGSYNNPTWITGLSASKIIGITPVSAGGTGDSGASKIKWDDTYYTLNTTSASWNGAVSTLNGTSANWNSVYSTVNTTSSDWLKKSEATTSYLPLSGGIETGTVSFAADRTSKSQIQIGGGTAGNAGKLDFIRGSDAAQGASIGFLASNTEATEFRYHAFGTTTAYMTWWLRNGANSHAEMMRLNNSGGLSIGTTTDPGTGSITALNTVYASNLQASSSVLTGTLPQLKLGTTNAAGSIMLRRGTDGTDRGVIGYTTAADAGYLVVSAGGGSGTVTLAVNNGIGMTVNADKSITANNARFSINSTVTASTSNTDYSTGAIHIKRVSSSTSDVTNLAGIGFENVGINGALLYYSPSDANFWFSRNTDATKYYFWHSGNFTFAGSNNCVAYWTSTSGLSYTSTTVTNMSNAVSNVTTNGANWNSCYSTVYSTSATWVTSSQLGTTLSSYLTTSAAASTYLPLTAGSGKALTGPLYINTTSSPGITLINNSGWSYINLKANTAGYGSVFYATTTTAAWSWGVRDSTSTVTGSGRAWTAGWWSIYREGDYSGSSKAYLYGDTASTYIDTNVYVTGNVDMQSQSYGSYMYEYTGTTSTTVGSGGSGGWITITLPAAITPSDTDYSRNRLFKVDLIVQGTNASTSVALELNVLVSQYWGGSSYLLQLQSYGGGFARPSMVNTTATYSDYGANSGSTKTGLTSISNLAFQFTGLNASTGGTMIKARYVIRQILAI